VRGRHQHVHLSSAGWGSPDFLRVSVQSGVTSKVPATGLGDGLRGQAELFKIRLAKWT